MIRVLYILFFGVKEVREKNCLGCCACLLASSLDHPSNRCFLEVGISKHLHPLILVQLEAANSHPRGLVSIAVCIYKNMHYIRCLQVAAKL